MAKRSPPGFSVTVTVTLADDDRACRLRTSGTKRALTDRLPSGRAVVERVACPPKAAACPRRVSPSRNSTHPVASAGVTVASRRTLSPVTTLVALAVNAVVVPVAAGSPPTTKV